MVDERGQPEARRGLFSGKALSKGRGWMAFAALLAFTGYSYWVNDGAPQQEVAPPPQMAPPPVADMAERARPVVDPVTPPATPPPTTAPVTVPSTPPPTTALGNRPARMTTYAVRQPQTAQPADAGAAPAVQQAGGAPRETTVAFQGQTLPGGRAGAAIDTSLVMMPGVYGCILDVAVNSERPGFFQCHTTDDILSPAGVVLMKAFTTIVGHTQGGENVRPGQARIPSIVATAWTPDGIPVPLGNAQASDALGRAGMDGRVNRHLAERFGGAAMLILSQSALDIARASLMGGNGNSMVNINTGAVQGVASEALRASINIPNTVEKNQGEAVAFVLTAPISFEGAIRLRAR